MKNLFCLLAAVLLCGCHQKPDPQVLRSEKRIADLVKISDLENERISALETNQAKVIAAIKAMDYSNQANLRLIKCITTVQDDLIIEVGQLQTNVFHLDKKEAPPVAPPAFGGRQPVRTGPTQMPAAVAAQIRADAVRDWPADYDMQVYEIKKQADAWRKLNP